MSAKKVIKLGHKLSFKYGQQDWTSILHHPSQYPNYVTDPRNWDQLKKDWQSFKNKLTPKPPTSAPPTSVRLEIGEMQKLINSIVGPNTFAVVDAVGKVEGNSITHISVTLLASDDDAMTKIAMTSKILEDLERIYAVNSTPIKASDGKVYDTSVMKQTAGKHIDLIDYN